MYFIECACLRVLTFYNNAAKPVQFRDGVNARIYFSERSTGDETRRGWRESKENGERGGKTRAGRRDKAIALHCQERRGHQ